MRGILRWANTLACTVSILLFAGAVVGLRFGWWGGGDPPFASALLWGIALVPFISLGNLRGAALRGLGLVVRGQLPEFVLRPMLFALLLAGALLLWDVTLSPANAIALNLTAAVLAFIVSSAMLSQTIPPSYRAASYETDTRAWLLTALPFALTDGMRNLQQHLVTLILAWLVTASEIGNFRVAAQGMLLVGLPHSILASVVTPHIARLYAEGQRAQLQRLSSYTAGTMFLGVMVASALLLVFGSFLLELCFGPDFLQAYLPMMILCAGHLLSAFTGPNALLLNMTRFERSVAKSFAVSIALNVGLSLILIPMFGIAGAATATSIALVVWNALLWHKARSLLKIEGSVIGLFLKP